TVTVDHPMSARATYSSTTILGGVSGTTAGLISVLVVIAVVVALVVWRRSRRRGERDRRRGPNPRLFSIFVLPVGRQDQQSTDDERAGGTNRQPRLERRVEPSGVRALDLVLDD